VGRHKARRRHDRQHRQGTSRAPLRCKHCQRRIDAKRRGPVTQNSDYAKFARRILRAYCRRIATGDIESLTHLISLADDINGAIQQAVNGIRAAGYSWAEIGGRLAITRQAAQQRWRRPTAR
jgi:hypothetical protein